jgi:hypothetical protein
LGNKNTKEVFMNTTHTEQAFYTVNQLSAELTKRGMPLSERAIREYINSGHINATKDLIRPKLWVVSHQELLRLVNQGQ